MAEYPSPGDADYECVCSRRDGQSPHGHLLHCLNYQPSRVTGVAFGRLAPATNECRAHHQAAPCRDCAAEAR